MQANLRIYIFVFLCSVIPVVSAENFILGYSPEHVFSDKNILKRVTCAFNYAGHGVSLVQLPAKRSLEMSKRANIDGDVGRIEQVYREESSLLPVMTPVSSIDLCVYGRPGLDISHESDVINYTLVPILGIRYFERFPHTIYKRSNQASSLTGALSMIRAKRGDYTFWSKDIGMEINRRHLNQHIISYFDEPIDQQYLFTMLNRKHKKYIPDLEKAYLATQMDYSCAAQ